MTQARPRHARALSVWRWAEGHPVAAVFAVALVARVMVAVGLAVFAGGVLAYDDQTYSTMARELSGTGIRHWDAYTLSVYTNTRTFLLPLTWFYEVFGPHQVVGQLFVAFLGAATAALTARLAAEAVSRGWALLAGLIVGLLPSQIIWSSAVLKDAFVWLLLVAVALGVAVASRSTGRYLILPALLVVTALFLLAFLRMHSFVVSVWAVAIAAWFGIASSRLLRGIAGVAIAILLPWMIGAGPGGFGFLTNVGSFEQRRVLNALGANTAFVEIPTIDGVARIGGISGGLNSFTGRGGTYSRGGVPSAFDAWAVTALPDDALPAWGFELTRPPPPEVEPPPPPPTLASADIAHLPRGLVVMLLEPVPWRAGGTTQLRLARVEAVVWYPLLLLALVGLIRAVRYLRIAAFPLVAGGGILFGYALSEGNIGTAFRHRGELVWVVSFLAVFGAVTLIGRRSREARSSSVVRPHEESALVGT